MRVHCCRLATAVLTVAIILSLCHVTALLLLEVPVVIVIAERLVAAYDVGER